MSILPYLLLAWSIIAPCSPVELSPSVAPIAPGPGYHLADSEWTEWWPMEYTRLQAGSTWRVVHYRGLHPHIEVLWRVRGDRLEILERGHVCPCQSCGAPWIARWQPWDSARRHVLHWDSRTHTYRSRILGESTIAVATGPGTIVLQHYSRSAGWHRELASIVP